MAAPCYFWCLVEIIYKFLIIKRYLYKSAHGIFQSPSCTSPNPLWIVWTSNSYLLQYFLHCLGIILIQSSVDMQCQIAWQWFLHIPDAHQFFLIVHVHLIDEIVWWLPIGIKAFCLECPARRTLSGIFQHSVPVCDNRLELGMQNDQKLLFHLAVAEHTFCFGSLPKQNAQNIQTVVTNANHKYLICLYYF